MNIHVETQVAIVLAFAALIYITAKVGYSLVFKSSGTELQAHPTHDDNAEQALVPAAKPESKKPKRKRR